MSFLNFLPPSLPFMSLFPVFIGLTLGATALFAKKAIQMAGQYKIAGRFGRFPKGGFPQEIRKSDALQILGIQASNPSKSLIQERHRSLMKYNHPDLGGSPLISSKINEAKKVLEE
eukprot:NODE_17_length_41373_cov_0.337016.p28 type:complete len:116 gc:universal NODE_17_length_41373_cov_0.337016:35165-35512(+)